MGGHTRARFGIIVVTTDSLSLLGHHFKHPVIHSVQSCSTVAFPFQFLMHWGATVYIHHQTLPSVEVATMST